MKPILNMKTKIRTRDGRSARILCVDSGLKGYPVVALIRESRISEWPYCFTADGRYLNDGHERSIDLIPLAPSKPTRTRSKKRGKR